MIIIKRVCRFAHLTIQLVLMIWILTEMKVCCLPIGSLRYKNADAA